MAQVSFTYETFALPNFAAEPFSAEKLIPGGGRIIPSAFPYVNAVTVTVGAAGAAVDATSIPVDAIAMANPASNKSGVVIPAGTTLDFGGDKFATLTADASIGDTSLTVRALVTALVENDTATYDGMDQRKPVAAGTLVGRTFAERAAGTGFGQPDVATPDDELYLLAFAVQDAAIDADAALLRHDTLIYEDKLPGWAGLSATAQAAIRSRYHCIVSAG